VEAGRKALPLLLREIGDSGQGSFLAVLKLLGRAGGGLSFPMPGYTLALDFPRTPAVLALLERLDAIVLEHGGRLYLAKDARMSAATFARSYPALDRFDQVRHAYGASGVFRSHQSERLGLS
jgi:FAD/FMN-containing dehydrogenase